MELSALFACDTIPDASPPHPPVAGSRELERILCDVAGYVLGESSPEDFAAKLHDLADRIARSATRTPRP